MFIGDNSIIIASDDKWVDIISEYKDNWYIIRIE
jgi:hypothetical protein